MSNFGGRKNLQFFIGKNVFLQLYVLVLQECVMWYYVSGERINHVLQISDCNGKYFQRNDKLPYVDGPLKRRLPSQFIST